MPDHPNLSDHILATADRVHAGGRNLFHQLVTEIKQHRATCTDCGLVTEELAVTAIAEQIVYAMAVGMVPAVRRIAEGLAYAAVRVANDQPTAPNLADYTATEGGPFDA